MCRCCCHRLRKKRSRYCFSLCWLERICICCCFLCCFFSSKLLQLQEWVSSAKVMRRREMNGKNWKSLGTEKKWTFSWMEWTYLFATSFCKLRSRWSIHCARKLFKIQSFKIIWEIINYNQPSLQGIVPVVCVVFMKVYIGYFQCTATWVLSFQSKTCFKSI